MSHIVKLHKRAVRHYYEVFREGNKVDTSRSYFSYANAKRAAKKVSRDIKAKFLES